MPELRDALAALQFDIEEVESDPGSRLRELFDLLVAGEVGSDEEWVEAIRSSLAAGVLSYLFATPELPESPSSNASPEGAEEDPAFRLHLSALGILAMFNRLDPGCLARLASGDPLTVAHLLGRGGRCLANTRVAEQQLMALGCMAEVLAAAEEAKLPLRLSGGEAVALVRAVLDAVSGSEEGVFLAAAGVVLALNELSFAGSHGVLRELRRHPARSSLQEAVMHILNEESFPNSDDALAKHVLHFCQDVLEEESMDEYFFINDVKIMVDIIVRESINRPGLDPLRSEYLILMQHIVERSTWAGKGEQHRRADVESMLEETLATPEVPEATRKAAGTAVKLLTEVPA